MNCGCKHAMKKRKLNYKVTHYGYEVSSKITSATSPWRAILKTFGNPGSLADQVWKQGFLTRFGYDNKVLYDVRVVGISRKKKANEETNPVRVRRKKTTQEKLIAKNKQTGIKIAYWESTGRKAKSVKQAADYFGIQVPNPVRVRRLPRSSKFRVSSSGRVRAFATTRERAGRQARLLRARAHGFKPTGRPARSVIKRAKAIRARKSDTILFAIRRGSRITLRTRPVGGKVVARNLTVGDLKKRARQHHFKLRSL